MAHLDSSYSSYDTFLGRADNIWSVDLDTLNNSGASGTGLLATSTDDDGTNYLNAAIQSDGLTPNQPHAQHIHGTFDGDGNPTDSVSPGLAADTDQDGIVEVLEGAATYGDILLPLQDADGNFPTADANGEVSFIQEYDLANDDQFQSPVTMNEYASEDIMPLTLREIVQHGVDVPDGLGAGTEGEVDGGENGFTGILPADSGEIEAVDISEARDILEDQRADASDTFVFGDDDDTFDAGPGDDTVSGGGGDDTLSGGGDDDTLIGVAGADTLSGGAGNDRINAGTGDDTARGDAGNDFLAGNAGDDQIGGGSGSDQIFGNAGDDFLNGGFANDRANGGAGADEFFHAGVAGHGTDFVQDYDAGEGDVLFYGDASASNDDFAVNFATTANAGDDGTQEAFVTNTATGQIVWALIDGAAQDSINLEIAGGTEESFDLLA